MKAQQHPLEAVDPCGETRLLFLATFKRKIFHASQISQTHRCLRCALDWKARD